VAVIVLTSSSLSSALAWISSSFPRPRAKRASAYAIINSLGNIAQIWSPYLYPKDDAPKYTKAFMTNSIMTVVSILGCFILRWCLTRNNRQMERQEAQILEGLPEKGIAVADGQKKIRYVL
jgi:MFS family permease